MILKDYFLAQLDREAASTRKTIERIPDGHNDFKPHPRSMEFGYLAALVATMLGWIDLMINRDELNLDAPDGAEFHTKPVGSKADLLASLDTAVGKARLALESTTDEHLARPWAFKMGGAVVSQNPRSIMIADAVFSHLAHHRGQLTVYLRLLEAKVPAIFGPSADERF
ncbi:MAG: hypothetical protein JST28_20745 [Acidobacteria bacterium]|nr:hypothetical protein [Acidobacteriota bacterium]